MATMTISTMIAEIRPAICGGENILITSSTSPQGSKSPVTHARMGLLAKTLQDLSFASCTLLDPRSGESGTCCKSSERSTEYVTHSQGDQLLTGEQGGIFFRHSTSILYMQSSVSSLPNQTHCQLYTCLIAIDGIIILEGVDAGHRKGHCKANDGNTKAVSDGILESLPARCDRGLKPEIEIKQVRMLPTQLEAFNSIHVSSGESPNSLARPQWPLSPHLA